MGYSVKHSYVWIACGSQIKMQRVSAALHIQLFFVLRPFSPLVILKYIINIITH